MPHFKPFFSVFRVDLEQAIVCWSEVILFQVEGCESVALL